MLYIAFLRIEKLKQVDKIDFSQSYITSIDAHQAENKVFKIVMAAPPVGEENKAEDLKEAVLFK
jgi:hypothetical protein